MAINKNEKYITFEALQQHAKNTIKKTREHDAGVVGGYNGSFPLTTATKGNIYLLPSTQKYYVCITDYNGSQLTVPNANFEELSVYANRSKLDNLFSKWVVLQDHKVLYGSSYIREYKVGDEYWVRIFIYNGGTGSELIPSDTLLASLSTVPIHDMTVFMAYQGANVDPSYPFTYVYVSTNGDIRLCNEIKTRGYAITALFRIR